MSKLLFPRIAHNYAKKGFYPTDTATMDRILNFIQVEKSGFMRVVDPCCGEGVALKEIQHHLGDTCYSYGVELDNSRSVIAKTHLNHVLQSDYFDAIVEAQKFDVMLFNPPYGDLVTDTTTMRAGEKRLEKKFFRHTVGLLRPGGLSIMLLPYTVLDKNFAERIARNFDSIQVFKAVDSTFKQVVIFGRKCRSHSPKTAVVKQIEAVKDKWHDVPIISEVAKEPYVIKPIFDKSNIKFKTLNITESLIVEEMAVNKNCLWQEFNTIFSHRFGDVPQPVMQPSPWHMAMAVVSGCVGGVVENDDGDIFLIKGSSRKTIIETNETNTLTSASGNSITQNIKREKEQFAAEIMAINFTKGADYGDVICIK